MIEKSDLIQLLLIKLIESDHLRMFAMSDELIVAYAKRAADLADKIIEK